MIQNSKKYWEDRYTTGGNSGSGSYGILAKYKANIINEFIKEKEINSVVEFGCGDGNQLGLLQCKKYIGYDVSETSIKICKEKFKHDKTKKFFMYEQYNNNVYDLSLSLDVIFHLIEDGVFNEYMEKLFDSSNKYVIIYSSNGEYSIKKYNMFDRRFTDWVDENRKNFFLTEKIKNPHKYDITIRDGKNTSVSDFYIYEKLL